MASFKIVAVVFGWLSLAGVVTANLNHVDFVLHFFGQMELTNDQPSNMTWSVTSTAYSTSTKTKLEPGPGIESSVIEAVGPSASFVATQWNNGSPSTFFAAGTISFAPEQGYDEHMISFETVNPGTVVELNSTEVLNSAAFVITGGWGAFADARGSFVVTSHVNTTSGTFKDYQVGRIFLPHKMKS